MPSSPGAFFRVISRHERGLNPTPRVQRYSRELLEGFPAVNASHLSGAHCSRPEDMGLQVPPLPLFFYEIHR